MRELYGAVWRVSGREQVLLVALALFVAGLASVPLRFQQLAINGLVERPDVHALAWNCAGFVCAILLSAALKFVLGLVALPVVLPRAGIVVALQHWINQHVRSRV